MKNFRGLGERYNRIFNKKSNIRVFFYQNIHPLPSLQHNKQNIRMTRLKKSHHFFLLILALILQND